MTFDSVELRHEVDRTDTRILRARTHDGGLRIEGHDIGEGVEAVFGKGLTEYEWVVDVAEADLPRLVEALGGRPGEHIINVIRRTYVDDPDHAETVIRDHDIPRKLWNRIGE